MANRLTRVSIFRTNFVRRGDVAQTAHLQRWIGLRGGSGQGECGLRID